MTPRPRPRRGAKLAEQVAQQLVADIARTAMAPGERLPSEVTMAAERGVSRGTLREALRILEVHGLVTIRPGPGGGPELVELTAADFARSATLHFHRAGVTFRQLLEARLVLEPRMAELAAAKRSPEQLNALRANLARHAQASDPEGLNVQAQQFHEIVSEMAGNDNRVLSLMTSSLFEIFEIYSRQSRQIEAMQQTVHVHDGIADAIEEGDARRAGELMEKHMQASVETFAEQHPTLIDSTVSWLSG